MSICYHAQIAFSLSFSNYERANTVIQSIVLKFCYRIMKKKKRCFGNAIRII